MIFLFFSVIDQKTIKTKRIAKSIKKELSKEVFLKNGCVIIAKREEMTSAAVRKCYQHCFSHPTNIILVFSRCNFSLTPQQVKTTASILFSVSIADSTLNH
jgi:Cft2 family RNA processing exonuclease